MMTVLSRSIHLLPRRPDTFVKMLDKAMMRVPKKHKRSARIEIWGEYLVLVCHDPDALAKEERRQKRILKQRRRDHKTQVAAFRELGLTPPPPPTD